MVQNVCSFIVIPGQKICFFLWMMSFIKQLSWNLQTGHSVWCILRMCSCWLGHTTYSHGQSRTCRAVSYAHVTCRDMDGTRSSHHLYILPCPVTVLNRASARASNTVLGISTSHSSNCGTNRRIRHGRGDGICELPNNICRRALRIRPYITRHCARATKVRSRLSARNTHFNNYGSQAQSARLPIP